MTYLDESRRVLDVVGGGVLAFRLEHERDLLKTMYESEAGPETGSKRSSG